jgi:hypothetical protein
MSVDNARNDLQDIDRLPPEEVLPHEPHEATIFMIEPLLQATRQPALQRVETAAGVPGFSMQHPPKFV